MKGLTTSLNFTLCLSLILSSVGVYASGESTGRTDNAYLSSKHFCDKKAEDMMEKLNQVNRDNNDKVVELRKDVQYLENHRRIIAEVTVMKNDYQAGLKKISDTHQDKEKEKKEKTVETLNNFKSVIRNGLTLNALSVMLKEEDLSKSEVFNISQLCQKNREEVMCSEIVKEDESGAYRFWQSITLSSSENRELDATLKNYKASLDNLSSEETKSKTAEERKKKLNEEVKKILSSIPDKIKPKAVLEMLKKKAPATFKLLSTPNDPNEYVRKCLNEVSPDPSKSPCLKIINDPNQIENLKQVVTIETQTAGAEISAHAELLQEVDKTHQNEIDSLVKNFIAENDKNEKSENDVLLPLVKSLNDIAEREKKFPTENGMGEKFKNLQQKCQTKTVEKNEQIVNLPECQAALQAYGPILEGVMGEMNRDYVQRANAKQDQINKIISSGEYGNLEMLKKYVAERYLRSCNKQAAIKDESIKVESGCKTTELNLYKIEKLKDDVSNIILNTDYAYQLSAQADSSKTTFNKQEMHDFNKACENLSETSKNSLNEICMLVREDRTIRQGQRNQEDWAKARKDSWYEYQKGAKNNYVKIAKKSKLRIFGEGILPGVAAVYPAWMNDMQSKHNIQMLTNQAMYQQQMLHSLDIYNANPWMYNYNYFAPYDPFSSNLGTGTTTSAGFNFGP